MTDRHPPDEELREAFQSLGEMSSDDPSPADLDAIWRAVTGELSSAERRDLVDRTAGDPALAQAWRVAQELHRDAQASPHAIAPMRRLWNPWWMSAAAALLIAVIAGLLFQLSSPVEERFRNADRYVVTSLVPPQATLPRDAFLLRWTAGPAGSRYHLRVTTEDLKILTTVSDLPTPEFVVPGDRLAALPSGSQVFWQVDVVLPAGDRVSSQTFAVTVQ